ncbi:MAG: hypothetical protein HGA22_07915, partial [Clostridiales bacterium]|nr:hypothetical protein [Clostridiales bacterium]
MDIFKAYGKYSNFVFIGETGSGKSEVALNFAVWLKQTGEKPVHFFDMDMTKPLFRSRDKQDEMNTLGIEMHYQEQFMDAPTLVGGVRPMLKDDTVYTVMDIGGDYIGARSIGGFAKELNNDGTIVFYVLNALRPWTDNIEHIDGTLGKILGMSHIELERLHYINNTNCGYTTTIDEILERT